MLRPLMLALALVGCAGTPSADAPRTVAAVDLGRYLGTGTRSRGSRCSRRTARASPARR